MKHLSSILVLLVCVVACPKTSLSQEDPSRVFQEKPDDARLQKAVTLDGYHAWDPKPFEPSWLEGLHPACLTPSVTVRFYLP